MYGVGKSSTTGSMDTTEEDTSSGGGLGKRSLVDARLGASSGSSRKRDRDRDDEGDREGPNKRRGGGGDDGGGDGGDDGGGGGDEQLPPGGADFPYAIAKGVGSFDQDHSAVVANVVQPPPAAQPAEGNAYVGNVITTARGKDKTPVQVAAQYRDEAFDDPAQAQQRFALVVGVNRMESVIGSTQAQEAPLDQERDQVQGFQQFPLAAFRRLWRPKWKHTAGPNKDKAASFDEVRAAAAQNEAAAADAETSDLKSAPVGPMRTATTQLPHTKTFMAGLQQRYTNVYVHVGDSDAVNLKAKATPEDQERGLFDRYDDVLAEAKAGGMDPKVVSGGYHFRVANQYLAEGQKHEDPHAGQAGRVTPQTAASSMLDMKVREGLAEQDPSRVYFPEPNMLIHSSVVNKANFGKGANQESKRLVESINNGAAPDPEWAQKHMLFDTRAGLYTDGGRFDRDMTQNFKKSSGTTGDQYRDGETDVGGLFHPKRNPQSFAKKRDLGNAIARMNGDIGAILDVYLPQQLIKLTGKVKGEDGVEQSTLDLVRDYLKTYAIIAGGIEKAIVDMLADPDLGLSAGPLPEENQELAATKVHGMVGDHHEFSTVALGDTQALSKALVTAIEAAKSFITSGVAAAEQKAEKEAAKKATAKGRGKGKGKVESGPVVTTETMTLELKVALKLCRSAAVATAGFLAQFFPQAVQEPQPQPIGPQVEQELGAVHAQGSFDADRMDVDPPGLL